MYSLNNNPPVKKILFHKIFLMIILLILIGCGDKPQVRYTTWLKQLEFAQQSANSIDQNAILFSVNANLDQPGIVEGPISYTFRFMRPSGLAIELHVLDTMPPTIVNTVPENGSGNIETNDAAERLRLESAIENAYIGPREILTIVSQQGNRFSQKNNISVNPMITLHMGEEIQDLVGKPAIWVVNYVSPTEELYISIDANSGAVMREAGTLLGLFQ